MKPTSEATNVGGEPICRTVPFKTNSPFHKLESCLAGFGFHLSILPSSFMRNPAMPMSRFLWAAVLVDLVKQWPFVDPTPTIKADRFVSRTLLHSYGRESLCCDFQHRLATDSSTEPNVQSCSVYSRSRRHRTRSYARKEFAAAPAGMARTSRGLYTCFNHHVRIASR